MKALFQRQLWPVWWIIITVLAFGLAVGQFGGVLNTIHQALVGSFFQQDQFPSMLLIGGLSGLVDGVFKIFLETTKFDPASPLIVINKIVFSSWLFVIAVGLLTAIVLFLLLRRALATKRIIDDIFVLLVVYGILGLTIEFVAFFAGSPLREIVKHPWSRSVIIILFLALSIVFGKKRVLEDLNQGSRVLLEVIVISFCFWPSDTAGLFFSAGDALLSLGQKLIVVDAPFLAAWLGIGAYAAWEALQALRKPHRPAREGNEAFEGF